MKHSFEEVFQAIRTKDKDYKVPEGLLALDPGETTGWAYFAFGKLTEWGEVRTVEGWQHLITLFDDRAVTEIICEDYRVYAHKIDRHINSSVFTLRLIGAIDFICYKQNIPVYYRMAHTIKTRGFVNDKKLQAWDYWKDGQKHSRDAIKHGLHHLLFNIPKSEKYMHTNWSTTQGGKK